MNVDNGIKLFKYNGVLALDTRVPTLYDAMFRPLPAALFPDRGAADLCSTLLASHSYLLASLEGFKSLSVFVIFFAPAYPHLCE